MITPVPLSQKEAAAFIEEKHRHHNATQGDKFRVGAAVDGELVGVVQVGRPVSKYLDDGLTVEVTRLCSDGTKDVCSFLYSRAARIAKELGYHKIITYILESEPGTSLLASGWHLEDDNCGGGSWSSKVRPRELIEAQTSLFPVKQKYPTQKKQRWAKQLVIERSPNGKKEEASARG